MNLNDIRTEEKVRLDPKCWKGKKIGNPKTKMKGGVRVNNCVPAESVEEDLDRRGFLRGLGMAAAGAAGLGAAGAAQARATPDWLAKVERAKTLMAKGQSREQTARIMGIKGPNPGGAGPMSGDWGAVNRAAQEMRIKEESNPEYDDEAGMADNNLETLQRAVEGIDELIDSGDNLPEWCQEKIAVAKSMLVAVWDYMYSEEASDEVDPEVDAMFEAIDSMAEALARKYNISLDEAWESFEALPDHVLYETAQFRLSVLNEDWQKVNKQDKTDGMSRKAVKAYRRENPGSKLKTAVTTKPSKLKKGGKAAKRRKSFCARMRGMKKSRASAKTKRNPNSPINKALRRWNC